MDCAFRAQERARSEHEANQEAEREREREAERREADRKALNLPSGADLPPPVEDLPRAPGDH